MLDLTKPMATKEWGKVTNWYMKPDWVNAKYPLVCEFGVGVVMEFTKDGIYDIQKGSNPETDLYNIEEKPYWGKPEDVPMCALFIRRKNWVTGCRSPIDVSGTHLSIIANDNKQIKIQFGTDELAGYEYYNGTEWKECRCE